MTSRKDDQPPRFRAEMHRSASVRHARSNSLTVRKGKVERAMTHTCQSRRMQGGEGAKRGEKRTGKGE